MTLEQEAHAQCDALHDVNALVLSIRAMLPSEEDGGPVARLTWMIEERIEAIINAFEPFI